MTGADPQRAGYDWRAFARAVRRSCEASQKGLRALAIEAGVTVTDLSRAGSGQRVSIDKVIAIADLFGLDVRAFYMPPERGDVFQLPSRETSLSIAGEASPPAPAESGRRAVALAPLAVPHE
jgi:hypothetical protein